MRQADVTFAGPRRTYTGAFERYVELRMTQPRFANGRSIRNALERAKQTLRYLEWFEVVNTRGHIENGAIGHFQVTVKVGFRLDDAG